MLDIGPGAGALVLYTGTDLAGAELEIRPGGGAWQGAHTAVRARLVQDRVLHAGVFGSLPAGTYDIRLRGGTGAGVLSVDVAPGRVTEAAFAPAPRLSAAAAP
jgi:hypothetical protein